MSDEKIRNIGSLDKKTSMADRFQKMIEENSDLLKRLEPIDRAAKPVVFCHPTCTTCKKALKWLDERVFEYDLKNIKEEHPTQDELRQVMALTGLPAKKLFNTSGQLYRGMGLKDKLASMSEDEMLALLASDGMLVKRPLLMAGDRALVGFKEAEWEEKLVKLR